MCNPIRESKFFAFHIEARFVCICEKLRRRDVKRPHVHIKERFVSKHNCIIRIAFIRQRHYLMPEEIFVNKHIRIGIVTFDVKSVCTEEQTLVSCSQHPDSIIPPQPEFGLVRQLWVISHCILDIFAIRIRQIGETTAKIIHFSQLRN